MEKLSLKDIHYKGTISSLDTENRQIKEKEVYVEIRQDKYNTCLCIDGLHISLSELGYGLVEING